MKNLQKSKKLRMQPKLNSEGVPVPYKCVLVGDQGSGKIHLVLTMAANEFPGAYIPTVFDTPVKTVLDGGQAISAAFWHTVGGDEYIRLRPLCYNDTDVFLMCFSIADPDTFHSIPDNWFPEVTYHCRRTPYLLVGTKSDLRDDPETVATLAEKDQKPVSRKEAELMTKECQAFGYVEVSAKEGVGLDNLFRQVVLTSMIGPRKRRHIHTLCRLL